MKKIPALPYSPSDFLRYPKHSVLSHDAQVPNPRLIAELHAVVRTGTYDEAEDAIETAADECCAQNIGVLYMAVEPSTGNTLLHTAMLAQRIDVLDALRRLRTHNAMAFHRLFYALFTLQNYHGDTMLHSSVRSGKLELVKAAMQVFKQQHLNDAERMLQRAEGGLGNRTFYEANEESTTSMRIGRLTFLLQQNKEGRTAADEARVSGHADIVAWLDRNLNVCDPHGERFDESAVQLWRESTDDYYGVP